LHLYDQLLILIDLWGVEGEYSWLPDTEIDVILDIDLKRVNILKLSQYGEFIRKEQLNPDVDSNIEFLSLFRFR